MGGMATPPAPRPEGVVDRVAVIGSGSWGTALARIAAINAAEKEGFHPEVRMWVREREVRLPFLSFHLFPFFVISLSSLRFSSSRGAEQSERAKRASEGNKEASSFSPLTFLLPHLFLPSPPLPLSLLARPSFLPLRPQVPGRGLLTELMNKEHENERYLPDVVLPSNLIAVPSLTEVVKGATLIVFCVPHQFLPPVRSLSLLHLSREKPRWLFFGSFARETKTRADFFLHFRLVPFPFPRHRFPFFSSMNRSSLSSPSLEFFTLELELFRPSRGSRSTDRISSLTLG